MYQLQLEAGITNFFIIKNREQRKLFKHYLWSVNEWPIDKGTEDTNLKKKVVPVVEKTLNVSDLRFLIINK